MICLKFCSTNYNYGFRLILLQKQTLLTSRIVSSSRSSIMMGSAKLLAMATFCRFVLILLLFSNKRRLPTSEDGDEDEEVGAEPIWNRKLGGEVENMPPWAVAMMGSLDPLGRGRLDILVGIALVNGLLLLLWSCCWFARWDVSVGVSVSVLSERSRLRVLVGVSEVESRVVDVLLRGGVPPTPAPPTSLLLLLNRFSISL